MFLFYYLFNISLMRIGSLFVLFTILLSPRTVPVEFINEALCFKTASAGGSNLCAATLEQLHLSQGKECIENANPTSFFSKNQHPSIPTLLPHPGVDGVVYLDKFIPDKGQP